MRFGLAFVTPLAALAILTVVACHSSRSNPDHTMPKNDDIKVTWSLDKVGSGLEIRYAVENISTHAFYLLDEPLVPQNGGYAVVPDRSIVQRGNKPHQVKFSRGFVRAASQEPEVEQGENNPLAPAARSLPAGGRLEGSFHVLLPIAPWHPNLKMAPIRNPECAVLEIGYLGDEPQWRERPSASGTMRVPAPAWTATQKWATSDEKSLP